MNDQTQPEKQPDAQDGQAQSTVLAKDGGGRLKADPILTKRFELLEEALHGKRPTHPPGPLNWNGTDESVAFYEEIAKTLDKLVPVDRPTEDLPPK
jgi:hypothetical protein